MSMKNESYLAPVGNQTSTGLVSKNSTKERWHSDGASNVRSDSECGTSSTLNCSFPSWWSTLWEEKITSCSNGEFTLYQLFGLKKSCTLRTCNMTSIIRVPWSTVNSVYWLPPHAQFGYICNSNRNSANPFQQFHGISILWCKNVFAVVQTGSVSQTYRPWKITR